MFLWSPASSEEESSMKSLISTTFRAVIHLTGEMVFGAQISVGSVSFVSSIYECEAKVEK